jgi:uncharacterized protein YciI
MSSRVPPSVRYGVFHRPGPIWQYGVDFREQEGVKEHVEHDLKFYQQGKLELDGPFLLPDAGGMMVATRDVSQDELELFAAADPAVLSGLLLYEIRPWFTAMEHQ